VLKEVGKLNLFAVSPIGATIQDGGKRKRSDAKLTSSTTQSSFIMDEVNNLFKYMKFVQVLIQTRIFQPLPHYQLLKSKDEQDFKFWKEVMMTFVDQKHNTEMLRNSYLIIMFQEGLPHEPYFIAIDN